MTCVLAFSDLHIGCGAEHRRDHLSDTTAVLDQIVSIATDRNVDLCLNGGDTFHRAKPSPQELHVFRQFCFDLALACIPMVALHGNGAHEAPAGQKSALELFESPVLRTSRSPEVITEFAGVAVCTLPAVSVGRLAAQEGTGDRGRLNEDAIDLLLQTARDLFADAPTDRPRILLAHFMVTGATLPNGLPVDRMGLVLPLHELESIGFDAIVLGDIHKPQAVESAPFAADKPAWYCGSPMCMDFGEQDVEHGVWVMDFTEHVAPEFIRLEDRRFVTVSVDLTEEVSDPGAPSEMMVVVSRMEKDSGDVLVPGSLTSLDETDHIAAAIAAEFPLTDAVVRVRVKATEPQWRRVDTAALLRLLDDAGVHKVYGGIQPDLVRETRARVEGFDETLDPAEAVALWLAANEVDERAGERLHELTRRHLETVS